jgi:DNA-binding Lrp family transcriptional regulator
MEYSIDNPDRRILYRLQQDARKATAPEIADEMDVSPSTVRKRIDKLEENGVVEGYHAKVDYAKCDGMLTNILTCKTSLSNRHRLSKRLLDVPGVINIQELMTGNENVRVKIFGVPGIGRQILRASNSLRVDVVIAYILVLSLMFLLVDTIFRAVQRRVLRWQ